jgi:hypothetical protein
LLESRPRERTVSVRWEVVLRSCSRGNKPRPPPTINAAKESAITRLKALAGKEDDTLSRSRSLKFGSSAIRIFAMVHIWLGVCP